jgi:6-phosphogluconate dehydrogenase
MKYLKKFEANLKTIQYKDMTDWGSTEPQKVLKEIDPEYFSLVFAEFIDEGATVDFNTTEDHIEDYWGISIRENKLGGYMDIDKYIESIDKIKELYLDIKSCINKIKDDYPNIEINFRVIETGENNAWSDTIERNIHLMFRYR